MGAHLPQILRTYGIQPSAQRVAVAGYVLDTRDHPTAEQVFERVREGFPLISRATIYNTLKTFVEHGLLRELTLHEGRTVYDPNLERHHHFIDEATGSIHDVPWDALDVHGVEGLPKDLDVRDYAVVLRGQRK